MMPFSLGSGQIIEITNSIVVGGVTSNSARFWVRTSIPSQVNIELSADNIFTNGILGSEIVTTAESGNAGIVEVDGLKPNSKYYYRATSISELNDNKERSFWTFPEKGFLANFSFTFGSCQQSGGFLPSNTVEVSVFDEIVKHDSRFFLQLGDWGYPDTTDSNPPDNNFFAANYSAVQESYWNKYNKEYAMDKLLRQMPVDYVYDDHDYMNNNSSSLTSSFYIPFKPNDFSDNFYTQEIENPEGARENSIRGYKENLPGYPLVNESRGIYHKFRYGNIEVFALDLRSQKSPALESFRIKDGTNEWEFYRPDGHSIIGRDNAIGEGESQLSWFLNNLKNSTADWKFIMSSVPFNIGQIRALDVGITLQNFVIPIEGAPPGSTALGASFELADGWSGFPADTEEILNFIDVNEIKNVIVLSGDSHNAAIDDGANAGLPEIMAGNLEITNSKTITLFESFGISIWNKGGHGISTEELNDAFGKVTVYGTDSVKLSLIDEFGTLFAEHTVLIDKITSVPSYNVIPKFELSQNFPNPFNPNTTIKYIISAKVEGEKAKQFFLNGVDGTSVQLKVYDILGREVKTLVDQKQNPGNYKVVFDAAELTSGMYFYTLRAGTFFDTKKMLLLK